MTDNSYKLAKINYKNLTEDEIQTIGEEYFKKWNLDSYSKVKIKKQFQNLILRYDLRI